MNPAVDDLGADEVWKEQVDWLLARLLTTAASRDAAEAQLEPAHSYNAVSKLIQIKTKERHRSIMIATNAPTQGK